MGSRRHPTEDVVFIHTTERERENRLVLFFASRIHVFASASCGWFREVAKQQFTEGGFSCYDWLRSNVFLFERMIIMMEKVVVGYTDAQNALIEEILSDYVNEGWSERQEDGTTLFVVDIPSEKVSELRAAEIQVNTETAQVLDTIESVIEKQEVLCKAELTDANTIILSEDDERISQIGQITVQEGKVWFVHGNEEKDIPIDSRWFKAAVEKYLQGFDEFEEFFMSRTFTVSELSDEQMLQLKQNYLTQHFEECEDREPTEEEMAEAGETIPDFVIYESYGSYTFTAKDFD